MTPIAEESSSIVPYASRRILSLGIRSPPTREVRPLSPLRVYNLLFSMVKRDECSVLITEAKLFCCRGYGFFDYLRIVKGYIELEYARTGGE